MTHTHSSYLHKILNPEKLPATLAHICDGLKDVDFDTLVVTGVSGCLIAGAVANTLRKNILVVRKENDDSHAGTGVYKCEGVLGDRWVFIDDLIFSGASLRRVRRAVAEFKDYYEKTQEVTLNTVEVGALEYRGEGLCTFTYKERLMAERGI